LDDEDQALPDPRRRIRRRCERLDHGAVGWSGNSARQYAGGGITTGCQLRDDNVLFPLPKSGGQPVYAHAQHCIRHTSNSGHLQYK
jgi:hypothetical protein